MAMRHARIDVPSGSLEDKARTVREYLPLCGNYQVRVTGDPGWLLVSGEDYAGWTLDGYVIPRLESGMIFPREITGQELPRAVGTAAGAPHTAESARAPCAATAATEEDEED